MDKHGSVSDVNASDLCPDCGVEPGKPHEDIGCDVARCLVTGLQQLSCDERHDCGNDMWTGEWPDKAECREYGLWAYFVPNGNPSWRPCSADHPGAREDLNRLIIEGRWDRDALQWRWPA